MAGPFVHLAAMEQVENLMGHRLKIPIMINNKINVMDPDLSDKHPDWNVAEESGLLFEFLGDSSEKITEMARVLKKDVKQLNVPLMSRYARYICHYIVDGHTIGHMAPDTYRLEKRLGPIGEFVWSKKSLGVTMPVFNTFDEYKRSLTKSMKYLHDAYTKPAQSWKFIFSWKFRQLIREAVKFSSEYTVSLIKLSWDQA